MGRLVFVESSCLVDTWSMATRLIGTVRGSGSTDAIRVLEAESARGTDPVSVHRALWGLLDGYDHPRPAERRCGTSSCIDRTDALGRAAMRALRWHRRAGDRIVVVSDLMPAFAPALMDHLHVDRVLCGRPPLDEAGRPTAGSPDVLLGAAAARAAELTARQESVPLADCVAYGREPRDRDLLRVVGHPVRIGYYGELRLLVSCSADDDMACTGAAGLRTARSGVPSPMSAVRPMPRPTGGRGRPAWSDPATA